MSTWMSIGFDPHHMDPATEPSTRAPISGAADMVPIQAIGIGMGIAVVVDATVVRALLVPATMRLMGEWNWWAPAPLARLHRRLKLGDAR